MQNFVRNGYKIDLPKNFVNKNNPIETDPDSEISRAIQFLTAMEICETCVPANAESNLKLGSYHYRIDYKSRIISVSE